MSFDLPKSYAKRSIGKISKALPIGVQRAVRKFYYRSRAIEPEILKLSEWCPRDCVAVDIGANRGDYSLFLANLATKVHCFEPNPGLAKDLRRLLSGLPVEIHQMGLSERPGEFELHIPYVDNIELHGWASLESDFSGRTWHGKPITDVKPITVKVGTLDDFDELENVGFIKIDVEGHEFSVLKGAERLIRRDFPNLLIEIEQRHLNVPIDTIFEWLTEIGYKGSFLDNEEMRPISDFDFNVHQADPELPSYRNNFFFKSARIG